MAWDIYSLNVFVEKVNKLFIKYPTTVFIFSHTMYYPYQRSIA